MKKNHIQDILGSWLLLLVYIWCVGVCEKGNSTQEIATFVFFIINSSLYIFIDLLGHRNKNEKPFLSSRKSYSNGDDKQVKKRKRFNIHHDTCHMKERIVIN